MIGYKSLLGSQITQMNIALYVNIKKTSGNKTNAQYKNLVHQYNRNGCSVICKSFCFYCYISPRKCLAKAKIIISKLQQTFCMDQTCLLNFYTDVDCNYCQKLEEIIISKICRRCAFQNILQDFSAVVEGRFDELFSDGLCFTKWHSRLMQCMP